MRLSDWSSDVCSSDLWSIRNPVPPLVLFFMLTVLGIAGFMSMDVNQMPDVSFPAVNVTISQPGAAPTEIETQITQKVEAAVRSVNGVDEIQSTAREGSSNTTVQFEIGRDSNVAVNEVKNAIDQARGDLPDGIDRKSQRLNSTPYCPPHMQ